MFLVTGDLDGSEHKRMAVWPALPIASEDQVA